MKHRIRKLLRSFGYDIRKVPHLSHARANRSKGHIIEMIGPSGVGKSTVYNSLFGEYKKDWYTRSQLRPVAEVNNEFIRLEDRFLNEIYSTLLKDKVNNLFSRNYSLQKKYQLLKFMNDEVAVDIIANSQLLNKGLFSDEGLTHNFGEELIALEYKLKNKENACISNACISKEGMESFFRFRSIISITASTEYIKGNLKKRSLKLEKEGRSNNQNDFYKIIGEEHLDEHIQRISQENKKLIQVAEKYGAEVLTIDVEKEKKKEIKKSVGDFIKKVL